MRRHVHRRVSYSTIEPLAGRGLQVERAFAFHHFPAFGDQQIARFLAKQGYCSRSR